MARRGAVRDGAGAAAAGLRSNGSVSILRTGGYTRVLNANPAARRNDRLIALGSPALRTYAVRPTTQTRSQLMTRSRYGMLAGIAGAAFAAWWWRRRGDQVTRGMSQAGHDRGETIFSNSPAVYP